MASPGGDTVKKSPIEIVPVLEEAVAAGEGVLGVAGGEGGAVEGEVEGGVEGEEGKEVHAAGSVGNLFVCVKILQTAERKKSNNSPTEIEGYKRQSCCC